MPKQLKRMTLKEQAYHALRKMIMSHRFSAGKWINVERLAKELGVSRTPVWQALKDLEKQGLVVYVPQRGMRMARMTPNMAMDLYEVRGVLEGLAAKLAAEKMDDDTLLRMETVLRKQASIVGSEDLLAYSSSDFDFHSLIYESTGNWLLKETLDNIKGRSRPLLCNIFPILSDLHQDHIEVLEALRSKDGNRAEKAMFEHNQRMRRCIEASGGHMFHTNSNNWSGDE